MKKKKVDQWYSAVEWASHRLRWELRIEVCTHWSVQREGAAFKWGRLLEGKWLVSFFNNNKGHVEQKIK